MPTPITFGKLLKQHRAKTGQSLREFCVRNSIQPATWSRLERGLMQAPDDRLVAAYAAALELPEESDEWQELFDHAAISRGEMPKDLLNDEEVLDKLPVLFRTIRAGRANGADLDKLIKSARKC